MGPILAIALKDLRIFTRRKASLFFTFIWPLIVAVMFGALFGPGGTSTPRLPIVVIDEDGSTASKAFVDSLLASESFDAVRGERASALDEVRTGRRVAAVMLRPGFGEASGRMFYGTPPEIEVHIDPSRKAERGMLEGLLQQQGAERFRTLFSNTPQSRQSVQQALDEVKRTGTARPALETFLGQLDTYLGSSDAPSTTPDAATTSDSGPSFTPVQVTMTDLQREKTGPRNGYDVAIPQSMLWAVFGCVMAFGTTFVSERVRGTMVRLQVAPLTRGQVLAGKSLAALFAIAVVEALLLIIGVAWFDVRPSSWGGLAAVILSTSVAFVGVLLLLASMARSEHGIGGMGPAVMMPMFMLGGAMIPLMFMPPWLSRFSVLSPVRWAIIGLEGAIWRDFSAAELVMPCVVLLGVGVAAFAIGAFRQQAD